MTRAPSRASLGVRFLSRDLLLPPRRAADYLGLDGRAYKHLLDTNQLAFEILGKGGVRRVRKSVLDAFMARAQRTA